MKTKIKIPYILLSIFLIAVIIYNVIGPNFDYSQMSTYDKLKAFFVLLALSIYLVLGIKSVIKPNENT
ncbi:hypothetical protein BWZ20_10770 [Winogradskyella sp. J14-2]|nr:hypothetical protein BWZ20_10770 [Winogradskyella sp. J14-2]